MIKDTYYGYIFLLDKRTTLRVGRVVLVARDAVRGIVGLGWGYLFYLTMKLLIDLFLAFVP